MKATKKAPMPSSPEARQAMRRRRRRRRRMMSMAVILSVVLVLALVVTLLILRGIGISKSNRGEASSFLAVKAIEVEGKSRYSTEEIIEQSGIFVGQSLMAVNKAKSHDDLLEAFPYLCRVEISNSAFDTVRITVEETKVLGAVQLDKDWMVVGENNHALERLEEKKLPKTILRIKGARLAGTAIGQPLLDDRSLGVCHALLSAAAQYGVTDFTTLDITEKTNVQVWWKGRVCLLLGNESNIAAQIGAFSDLLPTFLKNNGDAVKGRLDMTSYADDDADNDKAIFTPQDLLVTMTTTTTKKTTTGTETRTTGTTAATG